MFATHEFAPFYDEDSKILILGSFPSVKSREDGFYYAHKSNRFWPLMEKMFSTSLKSREEKISFLQSRHIALWDVVSECEIDSSSDSSIRSVVPTDLSLILSAANIECIFVNGNKAYELYQKYQREKTGRKAFKLPSTSAANASFSFSRLLEKWMVIRTSLDPFSDSP